MGIIGTLIVFGLLGFTEVHAGTFATYEPSEEPSETPSIVPSAVPSLSPSLGIEGCMVDAFAGKYREYWSNSEKIYSGDGGAATSADLSWPGAVYVTPSNEVLIADRENRKIRKVDSSEIISTIAGGHTSATLGQGDGGPATSATLYPESFCGDSTGVVYVIDARFKQIRKIGTDSIISNFAGMPDDEGDSGDGGPATSARLRSPSECKLDSSGNLYVVDETITTVRKVSGGVIDLYAGVKAVRNDGRRLAHTNNEDNRRLGGGPDPNLYGSEGDKTSVVLKRPMSMFIDSNGNMFISEYDSRVRKIAAGSDQMVNFVGYKGPNSDVATDNVPATSAGFEGYGMFMAFDTTGNMFINNNQNIVRLVKASTGIVSIVAGMNGNGGFGGDGGPATSANFFTIYGMVARGNEVILADGTNTVVRKLTCVINNAPTFQPTTAVPTITFLPSATPSVAPSPAPSATPSVKPSRFPTVMPSVVPSVQPSVASSETSSVAPSAVPSVTPSALPSAAPSAMPSTAPSETPTTIPSIMPSHTPSSAPSEAPSQVPSTSPSAAPSVTPSEVPSTSPSAAPSEVPSEVPSTSPSTQPSVTPSEVPSTSPSVVPSVTPIAAPTSGGSESPTTDPSQTPSEIPTEVPSTSPSQIPSEAPSATPSTIPSAEPSEIPTTVPSAMPSEVSTPEPSQLPSMAPSSAPSTEPTTMPTAVPSVAPSRLPSAKPTGPTIRPTRMPTARPSVKPTFAPSIAATEITFDASLFLKNVSASSLDLAAQHAVCAAAASTVGVANEKCIFVGQSGVTLGRRLAGVGSFTIKAMVCLGASTQDFEDTKGDMDGTALYAKLTTLLDTAVNSEAFTQTVRDKSVDFNAASTQNVGEVTYTVSPMVVVTREEKDDDLTTGEFSGVVIGVLVAALLCFALLWFVCAQQQGAATQASHNTANKPANKGAEVSSSRVDSKV